MKAALARSERAPTSPETANHLAWLRTRFAVERTFMAWVRTTAAMIGFGFTIVEFFSRLSSMNDVTPARSRDVPLVVGSTLICAGVIALAIAFTQHLRAIRQLDTDDLAAPGGVRRSDSAAWLVALAVGLAGIVALGAIVTRALV